MTESWDSVGRIAAVAAIRTFLNYFLDRDFTEIGQTERERSADLGRFRGPFETGSPGGHQRQSHLTPMIEFFAYCTF